MRIFSYAGSFRICSPNHKQKRAQVFLGLASPKMLLRRINFHHQIRRDTNPRVVMSKMYLKCGQANLSGRIKWHLGQSSNILVP